MTSAASNLIRSMEIKNLPTLPHILLRVLDMCNHDDASLTSIAEIISKDAALSSKVIGASNTALYNRQNKYISFEQNLALLGLDMVKTIVISSSFYQVFNNLNITPGFDLKKFWRNSLTAAVLAKSIAREIAYPHLEEAYLTGLMLNIGQLVLWSNFPKQYSALLHDEIDETELLSLEEAKLGHNHCEVGASLVTTWNLNSFIADAVLYHHSPQAKIVDTHSLIQIAFIANALSRQENDEMAAAVAAEQLLNISGDKIERIMNQARIIVDNVALSLGIDIETSPNSAGNASRKTEPDTMRQQNLQLALELRDIVLVGRGHAADVSNSLDETLSSIHRSAQILFGFQDIAFFIVDSARSSLNGKCLCGQGMLLNELSIPLNKKNSLVTEAFRTKTSTHSFGTAEKNISSILDEQIIRLLATEGIYCQPLYTQNETVGVLIYGISPAQLSGIKKQQKLLSLFAQQSAQAIALLADFVKQEARIKSEITASVRNQAQQIAHEANNPLSIIKNYMQLLSTKLSKEDRAQDDLRIIQEEINRVSRIFNNLVVSSVDETKLLVELNVNSVISDLYKLSMDTLFNQYGISITTEFDRTLPNIVTDKDKLIQILINLMKNAAEAMRHSGGNVHIATRTITLRSGAQNIEISIKDNGPGIPPEILENLFRPMPATANKKGSGLGLSIVKNLIDELQGKILCQSSPSTGTSYQILLPDLSENRSV